MNRKKVINQRSNYRTIWLCLLYIIPFLALSNQPPVVVSEPSFTINEDGKQLILKSDFVIQDVDSTSTGIYLDDGANYTQSNYRVYPTKDFYGTLSVNYHVVDNNGGVTPGSLNITVNSVNDAPVVTSEPSFTINEDSNQLILKSDFSINDVDSSSTGLYLDAGSNYSVSNYRVYPTKDFYGTLSVNYRVVDNDGGVTRGSLNITVNSVNDAPVVISEPSFTIDEDGSQQILKSDFDIIDVDSTSTGIYLLDGSNYTHTSDYFVHPYKDFYGTLSVNYKVVDNDGGVTRGNLNITVNSVNDAPVVISEPSYTIDENGYQQILKSDFVIQDVDSTSTGIYLDDGENYTHSNYSVYPAKGFYGTLSVNYRVVDSDGGVTPDTFNITVNSVNDVPPIEILGVQAGIDYESGVKDIDGVCSDTEDLNDLDCLIDNIIESGANTYNYRFSDKNSSYWDYFDDFLIALHQRNSNIQVTAYLNPERWLSPFSLYKKATHDRCNTEDLSTAPDSRRNCNATDLVVWAKELYDLKLTLESTGVNNLTGLAIDDYDRVIEYPCEPNSTSEKINYDCLNNPTIINSDYTRLIKEAAGNLIFTPTAYFRNYKFLQDIDLYLPYIDGIIFPVLFNEITPKEQPSWSELLYKTSALKEQIEYLKGLLPEKKIIPLLYATGYPADINTSPEYLLEASEISNRYADGVIIYNLQTEYMANRFSDISYKWEDKRALTNTMFSRLKKNDSSIGITTINNISKYDKNYMYETPRLNIGPTDNVSSLKFVVSGDFDASGEDEVVAAYDNNGSLKLISYDANNSDYGILNYSIESAYLTGNLPQANDVDFLVAGDYFGQNNDQILAFVDNFNGEQKIVEYSRSGNVMNLNTAFTTTDTKFNFDNVKFAVTGNFDSTNYASVVTLYKENSSQHIIGFSRNSSSTLDYVNWSNDNIPISEINFNNVLDAVSGNFTGDDRDELALVVSESGRAKIYVYGIVNNKMVKLSDEWFDQPESSYNFNAATHFIAANFDEDSFDELVMYYNYPPLSGYYKIFMLDVDAQDSIFKFKQSSEGNFFKKTYGTPPFKVVAGKFYSNTDEIDNSIMYFK